MSHDPDKPAHFDHDAFARGRKRNDFWGQIRRTVNGEPVGEEQIALILAAVRAGLDLRPDDVVLDLACGNGALSSRLFDECRAWRGVDFSEFLIDVAGEYFERVPTHTFALSDIVDYLRTDPDPQRYTKVLCYGSFSYLAERDAREALSLLGGRYVNVTRMFIGNLPDYAQRLAFYTQTVPATAEFRRNTTSIGIWRTEAEFGDLARAVGLRATFSRMPDDFYGARYRYDALLQR